MQNPVIGIVSGIDTHEPFWYNIPMNSNNNTPKTASEMLFHELAANGGTKRDIIDRLMLKPPIHNLSNADLVEAAQEIRDLRESVNDLTAWSEGVEADNDTLRKEINRLREERDAARRDFCNASYDDPHLVARERGWDCFKGETK